MGQNITNWDKFTHNIELSFIIDLPKQISNN